MKNVRFCAALLCAAAICACSLDGPINEFFDYHTGTTPVFPVEVIENRLETATDGTICAALDVEAITIPIDNSRGYELVIDTSATKSVGGDGITGVQAVQNGDKIDVIVEGEPAYGDELIVDITARNIADGPSRNASGGPSRNVSGGRIVYQGTVKIAYVDFDTTLADITLGGVRIAGFASTRRDYTLPAHRTVNLAAEAENSQAIISAAWYSDNGVALGNVSNTGNLALSIECPPSKSRDIRFRVSAPPRRRNTTGIHRNGF